MLFTRLKEYLQGTNDALPLKYIKFGENTHYVFHSLSNSTEESSLHLTPIFENYMWFRHLSLDSMREGWADFRNTMSQFKTYKGLPDKDKMPIFMYVNQYLEISTS